MEIADPISSILNYKPVQEIWHVTPDAMVYDAIQLMSDKNVGALIVMESKRIAGVVSERDYTRKVILRGRSSKETPVRDIMTTSVVTVSSATPVGEAMRLMTDKRIRHLPVVEADRVVGVISIGDLVKRTISVQEAMIEQLEHFVTGSYPG